MSLNVDLTIIIVNYETPVLVENLVKTILLTLHDFIYEILIVDNSKNENLRFKCEDEKIKILKLTENKGFANANNEGFKLARGLYLLFLNSDSLVYENSIDEPLRFIKKHNEIGALGIRQLLKNGRLDKGCKRGFPTPLASFYYFSGLSKIFKNSRKFGAYQQTFVNETDLREVDCVSGAYMLMKKSVFSLVGGFDEQFFLYGEDVDLCYRLKKNGFKNFYYGKVWFTHLKNGSGANKLAVIKHFYKSMEIFYDKHYKKKYGFIVNCLVKISIKFKFFLSCLLLKNRKNKND